MQPSRQSARRHAALPADPVQSQQSSELHRSSPGLRSGCQVALSGASWVVPPQRLGNRPHGTSLVAQWLRLCPPAWVRSLVRELRSLVPLSQKTKTKPKQYHNTFSKDLKKMIHIKKKVCILY